MDKGITSPVTQSANVRKVKSVKSAEVIAAYRRACGGIDVSRFFSGLPQFDVYECLDTQFRFYYPLSMAGDDRFYGDLGKLPWYYSPWRWEHGQTAELIQPGMRVLEVGAARGDFIARIAAERGASCTGLELSSWASEVARTRGLDLRTEFVQDHSKTHPGVYDLVCSFQVLEHVPDVKPFIEACLESLKPGGRLVVSVPNNRSHIKEDRRDSRVLNLPPHHTGLWDDTSLRNIAKVFPMDVEDIRLAPLEDVSVEGYVWNEVNRMAGRNGLLTRVLWKLGAHSGVRKRVLAQRDKIIGHTVMAVYTKR